MRKKNKKRKSVGTARQKAVLKIAINIDTATVYFQFQIQSVSILINFFGGFTFNSESIQNEYSIKTIAHVEVVLILFVDSIVMVFLCMHIILSMYPYAAAFRCQFTTLTSYNI